MNVDKMFDDEAREQLAKALACGLYQDWGQRLQDLVKDGDGVPHAALEQALHSFFTMASVSLTLSALEGSRLSGMDTRRALSSLVGQASTRLLETGARLPVATMAAIADHPDLRSVLQEGAGPTSGPQPSAN